MLSSFLYSHHALLLEGESHLVFENIKKTFEDEGFLYIGNPDIVFLFYQKFGILESRQIIEMSSVSPVKEEKRRIIVGFESITPEAQNALLKVLEDPVPHTHFIFVVRAVGGLLPTLRSRFLLVQGASRQNSSEKKALAFLKADFNQKMKIIDELLQVYKTTESKNEMQDFVESVYIQTEKTKENIYFLNMVAKILTYLPDKSSSPKILLESLVLSSI